MSLPSFDTMHVHEVCPVIQGQKLKRLNPPQKELELLSSITIFANSSHQTETFTIFETPNSQICVSELHNICRSTDSWAPKLRMFQLDNREVFYFGSRHFLWVSFANKSKEESAHASLSLFVILITITFLVRPRRNP